MRCIATGICLLFLTLTVVSQTQTTGRIAGTVKDQNGAVIVGASVTLINQANGEERTATTDTEGNYAFAFLTPGVYRVRVEASGFGTFKAETVTVSISETTTINAALTVSGIVVDPINVNNLAPLVKTDSPTLGQAFNGRTIAELPLPTRNFTQLLGLTAGTATYLSDSTVVGRNTQNASVNGSRFTQNNFQINGVEANTGILADLPLANPALESIAEFKAQTSLYDATAGRAGGGNIQIITRSGTNEFHGAVYDYFRDTALNANNPFLKAVGVPRPVLERNIFGATLGGALKKERAFFFVSYQTTRERNGASFWNSLSVNLPIDPLLTNDRSETTLRNSYNLPSINPTALRLLNARLPNGQFLIPTPQASGRFSGSAISTFRDEQFNANFDYRINQRNLLSVKLFFSDAPQVVALGDQTLIPGVSIKQENGNRILSVQDTHTFNSNITNSARFGYNLIRSYGSPQQEVGNSDFGITRSTVGAFPGLPLIAAFGISFGTGWAEDVQTRAPTMSFADTISITHGKHTLRLGAEIRSYRFDTTNNFLTRGQIAIDTFTDFLNGSILFATLGNGVKERDLRTADYNFFAQDDWKILPMLTLNLGLRYELDLPPYDTKGRISTFDPSFYHPPASFSVLPGGIVQASNAVAAYDLPQIPNVSRRVLNSVDPNNFAPRVGFAFSPFKKNNFVVRGGYGVFYSRPSFQSLVGSMFAPPFYFISIGAGDLSDPFAPVPAENEFPTLDVGPLGMAGTTFDRNNRTPYIQQYNASLQFALSPDTLLEIAYVGSRGINLFRRVAINQARLASSERPIFNPVTGQTITTNAPGNTQLRAPFQGVSASGGAAGLTQDQTSGQSTYNSLQLTLTRRLTRGLQFLASYTFARSIDNGSGVGGGSGRFGLINPVTISDTGVVVGNQLDNHADRGVSDFDRTHRFVLSFIWQLPKPVSANRSKVGRFLLSGWQMAGIVTAMSGLPIDFVGGSGNLYFGPFGGNGRPNFAPGLSPTGNIPPGYYFNPFAFARPVVLAGQVIPSSGGWAVADVNCGNTVVCTDFGNVGRNILRGPRQFNTDFSISKRFRIDEVKNIEFRAEFFNLFNTVNYANPISILNFATTDTSTGHVIDPGDFGKIISTSNNPRLIQLAAKFSF